MNVYEKLNEARIKFQSMGVKKSGKNKFAGYDYYELADILPAINKIGKELKFSCIVEYTPELATLSFVDSENPTDKITFTSPMSEASLKGCHAVQNLGAVETYIKRYLYQNCFEIVEADALDMTMNPNDKKNDYSSSKTTSSENTKKQCEDIREKLISYEDVIPKESWKDIESAVKVASAESLAYLNQMLTWASKESKKAS